MSLMAIGPRCDHETYQLTRSGDKCRWHTRKINGKWYEFMTRSTSTGQPIEYRVTSLFGTGVIHLIKVPNMVHVAYRFHFAYDNKPYFADFAGVGDNIFEAQEDACREFNEMYPHVIGVSVEQLQ